MSLHALSVNTTTINNTVILIIIRPYILFPLVDKNLPGLADDRLPC